MLSDLAQIHEGLKRFEKSPYLALELVLLRPVIESGLLEELIDPFCDLLRRVLMAVMANAL